MNPPQEAEEDKNAEDGIYADDTGGIQEDDDSTTWHDVALSIAAEFMSKIRHDIYDKLGYSTSAVRSR